MRKFTSAALLYESGDFIDQRHCGRSQALDCPRPPPISRVKFRNLNPGGGLPGCVASCPPSRKWRALQPGLIRGVWLS
eukprot:2390658-Amphidinium_carterae.1